MLTSVVLLASTLLMVVAAISAIWLLKYARGKLSWTLISIAFALMAIRRILEFVSHLQTGIDEPYGNTNAWVGFLVSMIMALSVIIIGRMLRSLYRSERARKETESRFRTLFHYSSDEIFIADTDGNFIEVNQVACDTLGYTSAELLGKNFRDVKSSRYVDKVDENIKMILEKGKHVYETEHEAKNGKVTCLEVKSRLIDYQGQKAIFSIARDITERKEMERKILSEVIRAEENERKRIAAELHDGLGPLLSAVKLYIGEMKASDLDQKEKDEMIGQGSELIDEAISTTRTISNNLTPNIILDFGLVKAIQSFCKKINQTQKITVEFDPPEVSERFDQTIELILYRVFTELINNTLKHAGASKIKVALETIETMLQMTYMDNGIGFDLEKVMNDETSSGMGLKNIISRLKSVDGSYKFLPQPGKGTFVIIQIDLEGRK